MKPYVSKEVTFLTFVELLSDKIDLQRVSLSFKQFCEIKFGYNGFPKLVIKLLCFLT